MSEKTREERPFRQLKRDSIATLLRMVEDRLRTVEEVNALQQAIRVLANRCCQQSRATARKRERGAEDALQGTPERLAEPWDPLAGVEFPGDESTNRRTDEGRGAGAEEMIS